MSQIGRISGPLLKDNLLRDGHDLTFRNASTDNDLLVLNVTGRKIGIKVDSPTNYAVEVNGDTDVTQDVIVNGTYARIGQVFFNTNGSITSESGPIIIAPAGDAYIEYGKVLNTALELKDNYIKGTVLNQNIVFDAHGSGSVVLERTANVAGNVIVDGNIGADGNVSLNGQFFIGDSPLDTVTIAPDFTQSIVPGDNILYDLGSTTKYWKNVFITDIPDTQDVNVVSLITSEQIRTTGNTITSIQSNDALVIDSASGDVQLENLEINLGTITNLNNTPLVISSTGIGYVKINDTNGMRIPVGTDAERTSPEIGDTRWNTDQGYLECFDGSVYQVSTGGGRVITRPIMEEFGHIYSLIFG
jgi:hypothetical protein